MLKAFIKSDMMGDSCNLPIFFYKKIYIGIIEIKNMDLCRNLTGLGYYNIGHVF